MSACLFWGGTGLFVRDTGTGGEEAGGRVSS